MASFLSSNLIRELLIADYCIINLGEFIKIGIFIYRLTIIPVAIRFGDHVI